MNSRKQQGYEGEKVCKEIRGKELEDFLLY